MKCERCNGTGEVQIKHGRSAYVNWGCRCEECRAGHAAYARERKRRRRELVREEQGSE